MNISDSRSSLVTAGVLIAIATALGAFGVHNLKPILTAARFDSFQSGVSYHFFHALGLIGIGLLQQKQPSGWLRWSARLVVAGIVLFSGSIYLLTFGAPRVFGMVAPFGGLSLMAAWICFAVAAFKLKES
jgi:uncharacterized membrane protein YgdD (TMEM256/DUF423 family)